MTRDFRDYLDDMLDHAEKAIAFVGTNPRVAYDTVVIFLPDLISALRPLIDGIGGDG